jgi:hypothetical protein
MHYSYSVEEIAALYGVHVNTVRAWLRSGLSAIDDARPMLVSGAELRRFIEGQRVVAKKPCPVGTLFCFRCQGPRAPALGMADFAERETGPGNLEALCETCGTLMCRRTRYENVSDILPGVLVQITRHQKRIRECSDPCANCDSREDTQP